jgi:hypothetical protein
MDMYGGIAFADATGSSEIGGFPFQPPFPSGTVVPANNTVSGTVSVNALSAPDSGDISAVACFSPNTGCFAGASISAYETIMFQTLGPVRPGVADLYTYGQAGDAGDGAFGFDGAGPVESSSPVELGTTLSVSGSAYALTGGTDRLEEAAGTEYFWYVIYEADGVTPVTVLDVAATPEPSTWALTLLLSLAMLCGASLADDVIKARLFPATFSIHLSARDPEGWLANKSEHEILFAHALPSRTGGIRPSAQARNLRSGNGEPSKLCLLTGGVFSVRLETMEVRFTPERQCLTVSPLEKSFERRWSNVDYAYTQ